MNCEKGEGLKCIISIKMCISLEISCNVGDHLFYIYRFLDDAYSQ